MNDITLHYWNNLQCEICKTNYKSKGFPLKIKWFLVDFKYKDTVYNILKIPRPRAAYMIFYISHSDKNKEKGLYVVNMSKRTQIKLGRL